MAKGLQKSLHLCISKLKKSSSHLRPPSNPLSSTNRLLSACKYPKTPSFTMDHHKPGTAAATLTDVDRFLVENFSSLYVNGDDDGDDINSNKEHDQNVIISKSPWKLDKSASSSLVEEAEPSDDGAGEGGLQGISVAVVTMTRDPYEQFRRSMQEMVEAHQMGQGEPLDWDFLEELLFCYLNLNEKGAHKFILGAFVDMMVGSCHGVKGWTSAPKES